MKKEDIIQKINEKMPILKKNYRVKKIGVFGSFIRDEQKQGSDIDILVEFDAPIGFFDFIRLENFLSKALGNRVDLISKKAVKPAIKEEILEDVIYV